MGNDRCGQRYAFSHFIISIHVPATRWITMNARGAEFQSTFPRGERQTSGGKVVIDENISIHVPAWGTTPRIKAPWREWVFQSTFPRGERLHVGRQTATEVDFNPRSRVGNDEMLGKLYRRIPRFQSTFPRGERPYLRDDFCTFSIFQSTFPRGERRS